MEKRKDFSLLNSIGTALLAIFLTVPIHELFHALTFLAYGDKVVCFSAGAVQGAGSFDYWTLPVFHRVMIAGGSASILNAMIGLILLAVILNVKKMKPLLRVFLIQLMGAHWTTGFGYFMIGGLFGAGDWGLVFLHLESVTALRVVLAIVGSIGILALFFLLNYLSYDFIEDKSDLKERVAVGFKLHLLVLILGFALGMINTAISPANKTGELSIGLGLLYNMMWIPFFWAFMFTGVMKTLPPKKNTFLYKLPEKLNCGALIAGVVLTLLDVIVFGPGVFF